MPASSHVLDRTGMSVDDDHAVANAGLVSPATLLVHLADVRAQPRPPARFATSMLVTHFDRRRDPRTRNPSPSP